MLGGINLAAADWFAGRTDYLPRVLGCVFADTLCSIHFTQWLLCLGSSFVFTLALSLICSLIMLRAPRDFNTQLGWVEFPVTVSQCIVQKVFWLLFVFISSFPLIKLSSTQNVEPTRTIIKVTFYLVTVKCVKTFRSLAGFLHRHIHLWNEWNVRRIRSPEAEIYWPKASSLSATPGCEWESEPFLGGEKKTFEGDLKWKLQCFMSVWIVKVSVICAQMLAWGLRAAFSHKDKIITC